MLTLFEYDNITKDDLLERVNKIKKEKQEDEKLLAQLEGQENQTIDCASVEIQLKEFCQKVKQSLDNCTFETKRLALDILDVQVIATPEGINIKAIVPLEFITIERTSASLRKHSSGSPRDG